MAAVEAAEHARPSLAAATTAERDALLWPSLAAATTAERDALLWQAVQGRRTRRVRELLAEGGRAKLFWPEAGLTALQRAALDGSVEILELLLAARADLDARASGACEGETALSLAILRLEQPCVEALLAARADPSLHGPLHHGSPLHTAICSHHEGLVEALLQAHADVKERDINGYTPYHRAVQQGSHEIVQLLVHHGAEAGAALPQGCSVLDLMEHMLESSLPPVGATTALLKEEYWPPPAPEEAEEDLCPPARLLPELPQCPPPGHAHGILLLGERSCGKTSLALSLLTLAEGAYRSRAGGGEADERCAMPRFGQRYAYPEGAVPTYMGHPAEVFLTDTPPLDLAPLASSPPKEALEMLSRVHSWLRATLAWDQPHHAVVLLLDATAPPLWEDSAWRRDLTGLLVALRRGGRLVAVAVTKCLEARDSAIRAAAHGAACKGQVGRDPNSSYETFVSRYVSRLASCFEATARENGWKWEDPPGAPAFPEADVTVLDVPTWTSSGNFKMWQEKRGTAERPNHRYIVAQLERLFRAVLPPIRAEPWM